MTRANVQPEKQPTRETVYDRHRHMRWCADVARAHPVPLPKNRSMLLDLARIGVTEAVVALKTIDQPS